MIVEIKYKDVDLLVGGHYTPPEEQVMYYPDGNGYPGSASEYTVEEVFVGETDIYNLFSWDDLDRISELCIEEIEK